jgi:hypothetical protein
MPLPALAFATPRKLPKADTLDGRVVVLDLAFASEASGGGFEKITKPLIDGLGPRLAAWVDHHDHARHVDYAQDPRFVLATKAQHGACPEMVTPELVARVGKTDTIVCHTDFDGLCSAAKWIREGREPYPGSDDDARAIDTRIGAPGPVGVRFDRALRARPRDQALYGLVVRHLATGLEDASLWATIDVAARELEAVERATTKLAAGYRRLPVTRPHHPSCTSVAFLDVTEAGVRYDKTGLLLAGQERASVAALVDGDTLSLAAPFDSGLDFLGLLGLSGGMPTLVSVRKDRLRDALLGLGVTEGDLPAG